jgi:hypothetical protein
MTNARNEGSNIAMNGTKGAGVKMNVTTACAVAHGRA